MKNKIYNISHICFLMLISCFLLGSCMSDTINLDPDKVQEKELDKDSVTEKISATANDGKRYLTQFYNLDAIISVGYRVNYF